MSDRWLRYFRFWGPDVDADVDDEVRYHLEMHAQRFRDAGYSPDSAQRAAVDAFGDVDHVTRALRRHDRRKLRRIRRAHMLRDLLDDIRYGVRQLRAAPRFSLAVIFILTLGIGANTAMFSALDAAFLRPLPFPDPERLVSVADVNVPFEASAARAKSFADLSDYRADTAVFSHVAVYATGGLNLTGGAEPARVTITYVSSDFFPTMDAPP